MNNKPQANNNVNFSVPIKYLRENSSKLMVSMLYYPIFIQYFYFQEEINEAHKIFERDGKLSDEAFTKYSKGLEIFHYMEIKKFVDEMPVEIAKELLDDADNFFKKNYLDIQHITYKYALTDAHAQQFRNKLMNCLRIVYSNLTEMEKAWRYINNTLGQRGDNVSNIRTGMTGGTMGAVIGSFIMPGVGTFLGGAIGGYLMSKGRDNQLIDKCGEYVDIYINESSALMNKLIGNAKELYMIFSGLFDYIYLKAGKKLYNDLEENGCDANKIFTDYLKYDINTLDNILKSNVYEEQPDSCTWDEAIEFVHKSIRNWNTGNEVTISNDLNIKQAKYESIQAEYPNRLPTKTELCIKCGKLFMGDEKFCGNCGRIREQA